MVPLLASDLITISQLCTVQPDAWCRSFASCPISSAVSSKTLDGIVPETEVIDCDEWQGS